MTYNVYILENEAGRHYIGMTSNLDQRIKGHNAGSNRWTKAGRPWRLIYCEEVPDRRTALVREKQIKAYKGGEAFRQLVSQHGGVA